MIDCTKGWVRPQDGLLLGAQMPSRTPRQIDILYKGLKQLTRQSLFLYIHRCTKVESEISALYTLLIRIRNWTWDCCIDVSIRVIESTRMHQLSIDFVLPLKPCYIEVLHSLIDNIPRIQSIWPFIRSIETAYLIYKLFFVSYGDGHALVSEITKWWPHVNQNLSLFRTHTHLCGSSLDSCLTSIGLCLELMLCILTEDTYRTTCAPYSCMMSKGAQFACAYFSLFKHRKSVFGVTSICWDLHLWKP